MQDSLQLRNGNANESTFTDGGNKRHAERKTDNGKSTAKDETEWFWRPAAQILGPDAGLALHYLTGAPESSCYRYMRGDTAIPILLYRRLLHSPDGATWLNVVMDDCPQPWWAGMQTAIELCSRYEVKRKTID